MSTGQSTSSQLERRQTYTDTDSDGDRDRDHGYYRDYHRGDGQYGDDDHGDDNRWRHRNWSDAQPSAPSIAVPSPTIPLLPTSSLPSSMGNSVDGEAQASSGQVSSSASSASAPLIAGIVCGVLAAAVGAVVLWWFLRKRKRMQMLSHSKTILMSLQDTPLSSQMTSDLEHQQQQLSQNGFISEKNRYGGGIGRSSGSSRSRVNPVSTTKTNKSTIVVPLTHGDTQELKLTPSATSLPIQLPTFPPPTPRDRRMGSSGFVAEERSQQRATASSAAPKYCLPRKNVSSPITLPTRPGAAAFSASTISLPFYHQYSDAVEDQDVGRRACDGGDPTNDFYIDMLDLLLDTQLSPTAASSQAKQRSVAVSPKTSLSHSRPGSRPSSRPISSAPQTPTRPRSPSGVSSKSCGASPRVSKEARRFNQNFPPPPPPPSVPPPAIPADMLEELSSRSCRQRAATMSIAIGKSAPSAYHRDSSYAPISPLFQEVTIPRFSGDFIRSKRAGMVLTGASVKNMIIHPPNSQPPLDVSVLPSGYCPLAHAPFHRHQRSHSNGLSRRALTEALDQYFPELPLPKSLASKQAYLSDPLPAVPASLLMANLNMVTNTSAGTTRQCHSHNSGPCETREKDGIRGNNAEPAETGVKCPEGPVSKSSFEESNRPQDESSSSLALLSGSLDMDSKVMQAIQALRST
ncbi:hypothetical protein EDD11_000259 [Mortierella claussenii]|nr:hypothetical protein EDD11_000259 [Mortierella claussenii]